MPKTRAARWLLLSGAVAAGVALGVALSLFQPWRLVTNTTIEDPLVAGAQPPGAAVPSAEPSATRGPEVVAEGRFRSLEHRTTGRAQLVRLPDGRHVLQFVGLDTSDGPDLRVLLSPEPATADERRFGSGSTEIAKLKGNRGDQLYRIPDGVDLANVTSAVIWCKRFSAGFGVAPLVPTTP